MNKKLYAIKNDKGEWLSFDDMREKIWYSNNPTLFKDKSYAEAQSMGHKANVVELVEAPAPVVVSEGEAKILERAKDPANYGFRILYDYANQHGGYLLGNKEFESRLMCAYVNGYTVEKEKRYLVELDGLVTTDGAKQYLTKKNGKWFASRRMSGLHQDFTDEELNEAPEWAQQLNREEVNDDDE